MAGTARDEAERLIAAVLAMAGSAGARDKVTAGLDTLGETVAGFLGSSRQAAPSGGGSAPSSGGNQSGHGGSATGQGSNESGQGGNRSAQGSNRSGQAGHRSGHGTGWATGSAECCVCPVCRVIASMRDPSPETAVRLATGAGDLATGVAGLMRAFSAMAGERPRPKPPARPRPDTPDETWSAATRTVDRPGDGGSAATRTVDRPGDAWSSATNVRPADRRSAADPADSWAAATGDSASRAAAEHAAEVEAKAARLAAERAGQRAAAQAAARRAKEAAERVAEAVRLSAAARDLQESAGGSDETGAGVVSEKPGTAAVAGGARPAVRTPRKLDVWAAATADAGVAAVGGAETLDHDDPGASAPEDSDGAAGDGARRDSV